jgi:hypothetical protein
MKVLTYFCRGVLEEMLDGEKSQFIGRMGSWLTIVCWKKRSRRNNFGLALDRLLNLPHPELADLTPLEAMK